MNSTDSKALHQYIEEAAAAVKSASERRAHLRRRTKKGDGFRRASLESEVAKLEAAMVPIRSAIGRLAYRPVPEKVETQLRQTSKQLQAERQKLLKMLGRVPWN